MDYGKALAKKIAANPDDAIAEYNSLENTDGGRILNADEARELSDHYREDRTRSADVHEPASKFIKDVYAKKLAEPVQEGRENLVLFTAGGTGAGKSSSLKTPEGAALQARADIIYDTNMNNVESSEKKIQQALDSGRKVSILYTYREPVEALTGGALPRAMRMGRTVPLEDHVNTHVGSRAAMDVLQAKYADDPRVKFIGVDNSHGKNKQETKSIDYLPKVEKNGLKERLQNALDGEYKAGRISEAVRNGTDNSRRNVQTDAHAGSSRGSSSLQSESAGIRPSGVDKSGGAGSGRQSETQRADGPPLAPREESPSPAKGGDVLYQSGAPIDGYEGKETMLLTPNGKLPAKYRLVEVADLIPSHDPITFAVNAKYPKGVQERAYDKSKEAQARVIDHAQNYEPSYTVNTNPDAINGPPVVTPNGTVLGGNSRTMSTVRLYRDGNGDVYRNMLRTKAAEYGLKPEDVEGMKEPILVRQVDEPRSVDAMLESLQGERAFVGRGEISLVVLQFIKRLANLPAENWLEFEGIWLAGELSPVVLPGGKQRYCGENYRRLERYLYGIDNNRLYGGESGIRTHVRVAPKHAFQACAFSHSAISPRWSLLVESITDGH